MAVAFRSLTSTTYGSRTNTVLTAPAGLANDDILIAAIFVGGNPNSASNMWATWLVALKEAGASSVNDSAGQTITTGQSAGSTVLVQGTAEVSVGKIVTFCQVASARLCWSRRRPRRRSA
jgi:hypothetical protein